MVRRSSPRHLAATLAVAVLISSLPARAQTAAPEQVELEGSGVLNGRIMRPGKKPVKGAVVHAVAIATGEAYAAGPADGGGRFRIEGLPRGYYDIAVVLPDGGTFVADFVVSMPPSGKVGLTFTLVESEDLAPGDAPVERTVPGVDVADAGVAQISQKLRGRDFWKSPKGFAIIGGLGALVLLGLATTAEPEETPVPTPSPSGL